MCETELMDDRFRLANALPGANVVGIGANVVGIDVTQTMLARRGATEPPTGPMASAALSPSLAAPADRRTSGPAG